MIILVLSLSSCVSNSDTYSVLEETEKAFKISKYKQDEYIEKIKQYLNSHYWKYDEESVSYSEKLLLDNEEFKKICDASKQMDIDLSRYSGSLVTEAQIDLIYFNSELAGTAYFYLLKDEFIGIYYKSIYTNEIFSLNDRNIFVAKNDFEKYEDINISGNFKDAINIKNLKNGFSNIAKDSFNSTVIADIQDYKVNFYKYKANNFYYNNSLDFSSVNLSPLDIIFFKEENSNKLQIAILLGTIRQLTYDTITESQKVVFYDENFSQTYDEIVLEKTNYLTLGYDDNSIILFQGNNMEYYDKYDNSWLKSSYIMLDNEVRSFIKSDIDGNNIYEYIISDGKDIYIYTKHDQMLKLLWKTHVSVDSYKGNIFTADLNHDSIKEIYIFDNTQTTIRYILTNKGFISSNEDIMYGDQIYPGDFNNDGIDDYIKVNIEDNLIQQLYLGM